MVYPRLFPIYVRIITIIIIIIISARGPATTMIPTTKAPTQPRTIPPTVQPEYVQGVPGRRVCPAGSVAVPEAECLAAHEAVQPFKVKGRSDYTQGSWAWVPPGCSFQNVPDEPGDDEGLWVCKRVRSIWWVELLLYVCRG